MVYSALKTLEFYGSHSHVSIRSLSFILGHVLGLVFRFNSVRGWGSVRNGAASDSKAQSGQTNVSAEVMSPRRTSSRVMSPHLAHFT